MAEHTREEMLTEAYKRGILPPDMKAAYEEASRRGLIKTAEPEAPSGGRMTSDLPPLDMMPSHGGELAPSHASPEGWTSKLAGVRESVFGPNSNVSQAGIAPYYRMMLEGGGAAGGSALGLLAGPAATVASPVFGGVGYAFGKDLADRLDESGGIKRHRTELDRYLDPAGSFKTESGQLIQPGSTTDVLTRPIRDTAAGIGMGVAGELIARGVVATIDAGKGVIRWMKAPQSISTATAERRAGDYLSASTSEGPIYAKNAEEAMAIEEIINKGANPGDPQFKFTAGERSFDPNQIKAQQVIDLPQGKGANLRAEHYSNNDIALRNYFQRNFSGEEGVAEFQAALRGKQDAISRAQQVAEGRVESIRQGIATEAPEGAGLGSLEAIEVAKEPVRRTMNELEKSIPNYEMSFDNLKVQIDLIKRDPKLNIDQRRAVEAFEQNDLPKLLENGENTFSAMGISRTLGDRAAKLKASGEKDIAHIFDRLKNEGIKADIDAISDLARTGKVMEHNGKMVDADKLASQLEKDLRRISEIKSETAVDVEALKKGIQDSGGKVFMRQVHEGNPEYIQRLSKDYKNLTGKDAPTKTSTDQAAIDALSERIAETKKVLSEVSPGQDVGAHMRAYNEYASKEWFGRFDKGAVREATAKGTQADGTRLRIEQIPARFKTPSGAEDLITAVGPEKAKELMRGNLGYDLMQSATDANGKIVGTKLNNWLNKNKPILEKYGMGDEFKTLQAAQEIADRTSAVAAEFERSVAGKLIGVDPDKVVKQIISGNTTARDTAQVLQLVQGDKAAVKGLKNSFGQNVVEMAETTWKGLADNKPTISMAQFSRAMNKANEAANILYRDEPQKLEALRTMQRAYEITFRSSRAPAGVGSPTAEKFANLVAKNTMSAAADLIPGSTTMKAAKSFWNFMGRLRQNQIDEIIAQGIYDPDYAYMLIRGSRGQLGPKEIEREVGSKVILLDDYRKRSQGILASGAAANQQGE